MVWPVRVIRESDPLLHAEQELSRWNVSSLPVIDQAGCMTGMLNCTDLLRAGRTRLKHPHGHKLLSLPNASARDVMTTVVEVVAPEASLAEAAGRMLRQHIHRLFICEDRRPVGVLGTKEMIEVVIQDRIAMPLSELMHGSIVSIKAEEPLSLAIERLALCHHSGLVVMDGGWPLGIFTEADALAARDATPDDHVEHWMDAGILCLPLAMPAFRAAEQLIANRARRVLAVDGTGVRGILTGLDFARLVKQG